MTLITEKFIFDAVSYRKVYCLRLLFTKKLITDVFYNQMFLGKSFLMGKLIYDNFCFRVLYPWWLCFYRKVHHWIVCLVGRFNGDDYRNVVIEKFIVDGFWYSRAHHWLSLFKKNSSLDCFLLIIFSVYIIEKFIDVDFSYRKNHIWCLMF